ncbi:hypothetical protein GEMRC1_005560 [Eukaryota sp. GEM-RC1]
MSIPSDLPVNIIQLPYAKDISSLEADIAELTKAVKAKTGIKETDTGLSAPANWDLLHDKKLLQQEQPLAVARVLKELPPDDPEAMEIPALAKPSEKKYIISMRQIAKFVVGLGKNVASVDIKEGERVGVDRQKHSIQLPLPPSY